MKTTRARFIVVALAVCIFAIGMATFLNYFKFRSTTSQTVKSRILVIADEVDKSVAASLALGLSFAEIGTLQAQIDSEKAAEKLVRDVTIFDASGRILYCTNKAAIGKQVEAGWVKAAQSSKRDDWFIEGSEQYIAGQPLKNNFDLVVGHVALSYSRDYVDRSAEGIGKELLIIALSSLLFAAVIAPVALYFAMRGFESDIASLEDAIGNLDAKPGETRAGGTAFAASVAEFRNSIRTAHSGLEDARRKLEQSS